jgi:hypothetical protein
VSEVWSPDSLGDEGEPIVVKSSPPPYQSPQAAEDVQARNASAVGATAEVSVLSTEPDEAKSAAQVGDGKSRDTERSPVTVTPTSEPESPLPRGPIEFDSRELTRTTPSGDEPDNDDAAPTDTEMSAPASDSPAAA